MATTRATERIVRLLVREYGLSERPRQGSAVDVLVATVLSQSTNGANSSAAFARLKQTFRSWGAAADSPVAGIRRCIRPAGLSKQKAPRIRGMLRQIRDDRGRISLGFLGRWPLEEAFDYLLQFDGVGPKTALCVLLFAFGKEVFPVDTHILRITRRLGLLGEAVPAAKAHEILTPLIVPEQRYTMHVSLIAHGRRTCRARNPRCSVCVLLSLCRHGRRTRQEV